MWSFRTGPAKKPDERRAADELPRKAAVVLEREREPRTEEQGPDEEEVGADQAPECGKGLSHDATPSLPHRAAKNVAAGLSVQPAHLPMMTTMQKYRCSICGHIYDSKTGDPDAPPGTAFEDLPGDWVCPVCLAEKSLFSVFTSPLDRLGL